MYKINYYNYKTVDIILRSEKYMFNDTLAVIVYTKDEEVLTVLTKCLPDFDLFDSDDLAFVDVNNNPWAPAFLKDNDIAQPLGIFCRSGLVEYPLYRFNKDKLNKE